MGTARVTDRHTISHAKNLFHGQAQHPGSNGGERGVPLTPIVQFDLGAPLTLDADGLVLAATGAELPNNATITYTYATQGGTTPLDGANTSGVLDKPRNVTAAVTHGAAVIAMTIRVTGKDEYGETVVEDLSISAGGVSQNAAGKKAFKSITSIAITSAGDATTNTLNMGWGDVLGLPYRLAGLYDLLDFFADETAELATATKVKADATSPATATTGDVRGTIDPNTACNGTVRFRGWMKVSDPSSRAGAYGVPQFAG